MGIIQSHRRPPTCPHRSFATNTDVWCFHANKFKYIHWFLHQSLSTSRSVRPMTPLTLRCSSQILAHIYRITYLGLADPSSWLYIEQGLSATELSMHITLRMCEFPTTSKLNLGSFLPEFSVCMYVRGFLTGFRTLASASGESDLDRPNRLLLFLALPR
ncbi:hypothetical protein L208DRAFT_58090 [Tricholoma matsutake]|nr:hypothetical protein L208DRAFT_58090 [Tricholoma matsutake 945]